VPFFEHELDAEGAAGRLHGGDESESPYELIRVRSIDGTPGSTARSFGMVAGWIPVHALTVPRTMGKRSWRPVWSYFKKHIRSTFFAVNSLSFAAFSC